MMTVPNAIKKLHELEQEVKKLMEQVATLTTEVAELKARKEKHDD